MENAVLILVVDDEIAIRAVLNVALEDDGYKVILAGSGEDALKQLKKHKDVKGLVTDIRLGSERKMTGWEIARQARELNPDIAVVYMSGDSAADWAVDGVPKSVMVVKPFAVSQISTAIATLLNEVG
jgi:DNA-binding NtrC family response regulator